MRRSFVLVLSEAVRGRAVRVIVIGSGLSTDHDHDYEHEHDGHDRG
jgi:hypothetical protein